MNLPGCLFGRTSIKIYFRTFFILFIYFRIFLIYSLFTIKVKNVILYKTNDSFHEIKDTAPLRISQRLQASFYLCLNKVKNDSSERRTADRPFSPFCCLFPLLFFFLFLLLWAGLRPNVMTFPTYAFDLIDGASPDYLLLRGRPYPSLKSLTSSPHRPEKFINPVAQALLLNV